MSHPLEKRIGLLRSRVRRLLTLYGLSWMAATVLGVVVVLGSLDYLIRFQDRGLRVMASLALWAVLGWTCYRYLLAGLRMRLGDVELALRLQRRFPGLQDRLLSSVQFLAEAEDDPLAGSPALRRAVIAQTTAETERLDFSDVLDQRPPRRAALTAAATCLLAVILVAADPPAAQISVARLINPFGTLAWPQKTHMVLRKQVSRVAKGQPFELEVIAARNSKLPAEVRIYYRHQSADGAVAEEHEAMRLLGGAMVARRDNVQRAFSYRVEGGDDRSLPWIAVEVVAPPAITSLAIRLTPPPYSGWPPQQADRQIRALVGTRIEMAAETNKPLTAATLHLDDDRSVAGAPSDDGRRFTVPASCEPELQVEKSGAYWFELRDREGISGGGDSRGEIRALADTPPSATIEQPSANLFVTPAADVPLRITAKDDLAIHQVMLVFDRSDRPDAGETTLPLLAGPPQVEPLPAEQLSGGPDSGDRRVIEYRWKLADLGLAAGSQIGFCAVAGDYRPQTGRSAPRRLFVITPEELQERIASRQGLILAELERVLKTARGGRWQVQSLATRLGEMGRLEQRDADHLQAAELNQREVSRALTSRSEGVPMHVLALLADLENNKIDSPDVERRMRGILEEIERLDRQHLPIIGQKLVGAVKAAQAQIQEQNKSPQADAIGGLLAAAGKGQDEVIASLEQMLGQLARWDSYRRFYGEIAQLLRDQADVARDTSEVGRGTLAKELKDLSPQEAAQLRALAAQQLDLGRRLDRILPAMEKAAADLRQNDPLAAETIADALDEARRAGVSGRMRACGSNLQENQIGQAADRHTELAQNFQDMLDILANRRQAELVRLLRKFQEAERDLADLERQQAGLLEQMETNAREANTLKRRATSQRWGQEQDLLQHETERIARRLQRLLAEQAGRTTEQAAGHMGQAAQQAGQGDEPTALKHAEAARDGVAEARRQLAARQLQSQAELARQQLSRLEDTLKSLHGRQQNAMAETRRLEGLRHGDGQFPRAQAAALDPLARLQRSLQSETAQLSKDLDRAAAFQSALSAATREMGRAAALLDRRQTGAATQQAEQNALGRLELLLEAVRPEAAQPQSSEPGGGAGGQQNQSPTAAQNFAQLKLLKLWQEEINLRTRQLQKTAGGSGRLSNEDRQQYNLLAEEQGRLAELVVQLLEAQPPDANENSEPLPQRAPEH